MEVYLNENTGKWVAKDLGETQYGSTRAEAIELLSAYLDEPFENFTPSGANDTHPDYYNS